MCMLLYYFSWRECRMDGQKGKRQGWRQGRRKEFFFGRIGTSFVSVGRLYDRPRVVGMLHARPLM